MFTIFLFLIMAQCFASIQEGDPVYCQQGDDGKIHYIQVGLNADAPVYSPHKGRFVLRNGDYLQNTTQADRELETARSAWPCARCLSAAALSPRDPKTDMCTGIVMATQSMTPDYILKICQFTLDAVKKDYANAIFISALRGSLPMQECMRLNGMDMHMVILSSRSVTVQKEALFNFDSVPWDKVKEHGNRIVFWDDVCDTMMTSAVFAYWCNKNHKLEGDVKLVIVFNHANDGHEHKKGEVIYGKDIADGDSMRKRMVFRLIDIERKESGLPLNLEFINSKEYTQAYNKWDAFLEEKVERMFFSEYTKSDWLNFATGGGHVLDTQKPDIAMLDISQKYDVFLGCPLLTNDADRIEVLMKQATLSQSLDDWPGAESSGYLFADALHNDTSGQPLLLSKHQREVSDRLLCVVISKGHLPLLRFAREAALRRGYRDIVTVPCGSDIILSPYPLQPGLVEHKPILKVHTIHPKSDESLRPNGRPY